MVPSSRGYNDDMRLAHVIADAVDAHVMGRFKALDLSVQTKSDATPVTDADKSAEEIIRSQLARARSRDAILGEEYGPTGQGSRRWVIDPIDGTANFVRGVPVWATLMSLLVEGFPVLGLVSAPALDRRWWAATGTGAYTGKSLAAAHRIHVSGVERLEDAYMSYSCARSWRENGRGEQFQCLIDTVARARAFGDFWSYCLVAEGVVDIACEPELALHDMAALVPILQEAGGQFTSLEGDHGPFGGNAVATNGKLHAQTLGILSPSVVV